MTLGATDSGGRVDLDHEPAKPHQGLDKIGPTGIVRAERRRRTEQPVRVGTDDNSGGAAAALRCPKPPAHDLITIGIMTAMSLDLHELYQDVVLDHGKRPRNFRRIENATRMAEGHNPICGDHIIIYLQLDGDRITDLSFQGAACAICTASASMMTESLREHSAADAVALHQRFHELLTGPDEPDPLDSGADMGKVVVLAGVRRFPIRVKCATLPWHTMIAALDESHEPVSTE